MLQGLRGEESVATLCRREGIVTNLHYLWSKEFLEAGKTQLQGDARREAIETLLRARCIAATFLAATLEAREMRRRMAAMGRGAFEFVYEARAARRSVS